MADVALNPIDLNGTAGKALAFTTPNQVEDVHRMVSNEKTYLMVKNGTGAVALTISTHRVLDGLTVPDKVVNVPANSEVVVGPFDRELYSDSESKVNVTLSAITNVQLAAFRV